MNKKQLKEILKEIAVRHLPDDPDAAFGVGYEVGKDEREEFGYADGVGNLSPEEAIGLGYETGKMGIDGDHDYSQDTEFRCKNPEIFEDWVGIRKHAMAPHEESYRKVGDFLAMDPETAYEIITPLMDATDSTCPVSAAKAMSDVLELIASHKQ